MIGPEGHIHRWTAAREKIQRTKKMNESTKDEAHALQCTAAGPYNAIPTDLLRVGSMCGLGLDVLGIHTLSLAARYRTAANSGTLANRLAKIHAARECDRSSICALSPSWKEKFLHTSRACSTVEASEFVCRLDHAGKIADSPYDKKQKAATILLRDEIPERDFAKPVAARVSKAFGPVSRFFTAQIQPQMCHASRAARPRLAAGIPRVLCNGMCTAQRFHIEGEEQRCRAGCQGEPDSLAHYNECPLLYNFFTSTWKRAAILPRRSHLLHDSVTQIVFKNLQYGIVVMGVIDVFGCAHNHHRRNVDNPGNFVDCMKGRIRFLTTIAPAYAHAHQSICLAGRLLVVSHQKFRLPAAKARYPHLPNSRTTTRERGNDFQGWAVYTDGVLALPMVKPWLDGVLSHNLATEEYK